MSLTNEKKESLKDQFLNAMANKHSLTVEEVIEILKKKFEAFNLNNASEYKVHLQNVMAERDQEEFQEEIKDRLAKDVVPFPPCPICGADTFGDPSLYGKHTKTEGWQCRKGGSNHYYQWRTNQIRRRQGKPEIFPETEGEE